MHNLIVEYFPAIFYRSFDLPERLYESERPDYYRRSDSSIRCSLCDFSNYHGGGLRGNVGSVDTGRRGRVL